MTTCPQIRSGKNDHAPTVRGKNDHVSTDCDDKKQVTSDSMGAAIDSLESNRSGKNDHVPTVRNVQQATKSRRVATTINFMKTLRRKNWEEKVKWNENMIISSKESLPEDLQNFNCPMVCIGSDVVSLYPNLDIGEVSKKMKEAILNSPITWQDIDYLEATRYIALNWDNEKCRSSKLSKFLPRRRG